LFDVCWPVAFSNWKWKVCLEEGSCHPDSYQPLSCVFSWYTSNWTLSMSSSWSAKTSLFQCSSPLAENNVSCTAPLGRCFLSADSFPPFQISVSMKIYCSYCL
jgi:hypothetical protein